MGTLAIQRSHAFDKKNTDDLQPDNHGSDYIEPETWTIISALSRVVNLAQGSSLSDEFWQDAKNPLDFLTNEFGMTRVQIIILAILVENGDTVGWSERWGIRWLVTSSTQSPPQK